MKYKILLIPGILILAAILVGFITIHAENANKGLIVYPSNFDLTSGSTPTIGTINLINNNDQAVTIHVDRKNFTAEGEEGGAILTNEDTSFSLASWISVTPETVTIPSRATKAFTFTITPPKNAEPGGHFGSIVFATTANPNIKGTAGAAISQEVASLILLRVPGNAEEKAYMESFTTDKNFYEFGPVTFTARIKNIGAVHVAPTGQIIVKGTFGDRYYVNLQPHYVLPNSIRKIPAMLPHKLLIGHYTATFIGTYGTQNEQLHGYAEFYAFPVRYGVIVGIGLLVLFLLRKRLFKALKALITGK